jgi:UDP-N-acetylglucosamine 1-carboxyvinyltransferase
MDKFEIVGGNKLFGEVTVPCAKNSYLAILAGCVLCDGVVVLHNCPNFSDINCMLDILSSLGAKIERVDRTLIIDCSSICNPNVPKTLAKKIRSSIFLLGPLLSRLKKAVVPYPGGCEIGTRPIELHLKGLKSLGTSILDRHGIIKCETSQIVGNDIHLDYPSVGATENIMMAGVLGKGKTRILNSAKEPEIVDLQNFLNSMGAKIFGAGSGSIEIEGVECLHSTVWTPVADRIISGTYILAVACCGGDVLVKNVQKEHICSLLTKLRQAGLQMEIIGDSIRVISNERLHTFENIETMPYPGFPTDLQPQTMALQTTSLGTCIVTENLFETRLKHVAELVKMGANIVTRDRVAIVTGVDKIYGAEVTASDLRAGASLVLAGLMAEGKTSISNVHLIDRGYENLEEVFLSLGADIKRTKGV